MADGLETGFLLDRQWYRLRGEMERTKQPTLLLLARTLDQARAPYAVIGGVALQIHQAEPRTTLDIDVAVPSLEALPRTSLETAGFALTGRFAHSENWRGPDGIPVQFTDDPALAGPIQRAEAIRLEDVDLRAIRRGDLLHEKVRAAADPAPRRSKRLQDLADAHALIEATPDLLRELASDERVVLGRLPD